MAIGCVLALLSLIGTLFVTVPEKKSGLFISVALSSVLVILFGVVGGIIEYKLGASGGKTALLTVLDCIAVAVAVLTVVIAFVKIKQANGKKSAVLYQIVRLFAAAFSLLYMWFKVLRSMDYYGNLLEEGTYSYLAQIPGIKSNNIFMGLFLVMSAVAAFATLVVFLLSVFKEDKHKFVELLAVIFATLLLIVPVYEIIVHVDMKLEAPESVSYSLLALAFGMKQGTGINPVALVLVLAYAAFFVLKTIEAVKGRKNVIDYVKAGLIAAIAIFVLLANLYSGISFDAFVQNKIDEANAFIAVETNIPHLLTYNIGSIGGTAKLVAIVTLCVVVALVAKQIVYAIKESEFVETRRLNAKVKREGLVDEEKTFGSFVLRHIASLGAILIAVIGVVMVLFLRQNLFQADEPFAMVGSSSNAATVAYILFPASHGETFIAPNYFLWAYLVLTVISVLALIIGDISKRNVIKYVGVISGMVAGLALIVMQTSSGSLWTSVEFTDFTYSFNLPVVLFGFVVMLFAYLSTYKQSVKATKEFARIAMENVGVTMTVISFFFVILYLTRVLI